MKGCGPKHQGDRWKAQPKAAPKKVTRPQHRPQSCQGTLAGSQTRKPYQLSSATRPQDTLIPVASMTLDELLEEWRDLEITFLSCTLSHKLVVENPTICLQLCRILHVKLDLAYFSKEQVYILSDHNLVTAENVLQYISFSSSNMRLSYLGDILPEIESLDKELYWDISFQLYQFKPDPELAANKWAKLRHKRLHVNELSGVFARDNLQEFTQWMTKHYHGFTEFDLILCARHGAVNCLELLMKSNRFECCRHVFAAACKNGNEKFISLLLDHGFEPSQACLDIGVEGYNTRVIHWLLSNKIGSVNQIPCFNNVFSLKMIQILINAGVHPRTFIECQHSVTVLNYIMEKYPMHEKPLRRDMSLHDWFEQGYHREGLYLLSQGAIIKKFYQLFDENNESQMVLTQNMLEFFGTYPNGNALIEVLLRRGRVVLEDFDLPKRSPSHKQVVQAPSRLLVKEILN